MSTKKMWYVEALDAHTNEVLSRELSAENASRDVECQDGKMRDLWRCDSYGFITKFARSRGLLNLKFDVFYQERPLAPVKQWPFLYRRRKTLQTILEKGQLKRASAVR